MEKAENSIGNNSQDSSIDDIVNSLDAFDVTPQYNSIHKEHPRFSQYKVKHSGSSQRERRATVLRERKENRYNLLSHLRHVEECKPAEEIDEADEMDTEQVEKAIYRRPRQYNNFLMQSEWLVDVPFNELRSHFIVSPCPVGRRMLVVAYNGQTKAYSKSGWCCKTFPSILPGGNRAENAEGCTMLDCIFSQIDKTYYILDIMFFEDFSLLDSTTEYRLNFLLEKIYEIENVMYHSRLNPYRFVPVLWRNYHDDEVEEMLTQPMPFHPEIDGIELDGILFYHKDGHYTHGPTPLVGWLKPWMLPSMLGIAVPEYIAKQTPPQYTDIKSHIVEYNAEREKYFAERKKEKREKSRKNKSNNMEAESFEPTENDDPLMAMPTANGTAKPMTPVGQLPSDIPAPSWPGGNPPQGWDLNTQQ